MGLIRSGCDGSARYRPVVLLDKNQNVVWGPSWARFLMDATSVDFTLINEAIAYCNGFADGMSTEKNRLRGSMISIGCLNNFPKKA
jgi:hypothetical protein